MKSTKFQTTILNVADKIKSKRNILRNKTALSLVLTLASVAAIFCMTGVVYYRNTVTITEGAARVSTLSMYSSPEQILAEQGITLGEYDTYAFEQKDEDEFNLTLYRGFKATVTDGETTTEVDVKHGETVAEVLEAAEITLNENDSVQPSLDTVLTEAAEITVSRAYTAYISVDGEKLTVSANGETVAELLEKNGITLGEDDYLNYDADKIVTKGMVIKVTRVSYITRVTVEAVPFETEEVASNLVAMGNTTVLTEGVNGAKQVKTKEKYINGKLVSSTVIEEKVTIEPVNEVVAVGKALATPYSKKDSDSVVLENGLPVNFDYIVSGKACAYTAKEGAGTYSGRKLEIGTIAVDPNVIPFGSELYIVSQDGKTVYGYAIAADTGALTDVVADLYMGTTAEHYSDACSWGAKYVDIYVITTGDNSIYW
ncbi:MAG: ubiquitin-like domain-containing protein [Ruminiclostridium sp.]